MSQSPLQSEDKRLRILAAAREVCERRGVDGARMEEVAGLARVSKGTLYRYFESKQQLLLASIIDSYERFLPLFETAPQERDPVRALDALLDALTVVLAEVAPRMSLHYQAWGLVAKDPALQERLVGFLRRFHLERGAATERIIREGQRRGRFSSDVDVEALEAGIQALLSGFLYRASFHPESATPALLRRAFDALVREARLVPPAAGSG